jgi:hypothetical protein
MNRLCLNVTPSILNLDDVDFLSYIKEENIDRSLDLWRAKRFDENVLPRITHYSFDKELSEKLLSLLPSSLIEAEKAYSQNYIDAPHLQVITDTEGLLPHVDSGRRTTLNWYIEPSNGITNVYDVGGEPREGGLTPQAQHTFEKTGHLIPPQVVLDEVGDVYSESYKAENNEKWLIDVTKMHSVEKAVSRRSSISYSFCLPFQEVVKHFV